ncbi:aspartate/glutamate racemase family protein [Nesterenkonia sp. HG001]|uniref:aspartate/glutamate racemase family protein n=1 Tax=Nesterenkonia sp. HG001 TaxID=2983207 RepID=UPI002AC662AF|nr:amino acid racemase [Nesterenkonia sp. HG001]MDZ5077005.1 amino acid racemase [Nesterenkonia sp. HG001]
MEHAGETPLVGILGGMGPAATVDFYSKLVAATPATRDQDHLKVMIWSDPSVPDRSMAISGEGESPVPALSRGAQALKDAGADFYVVTCNGAHAFLPEVRERVDLEYLSIVDVAAEHLGSLPHVKKAGVLATNATITAQLYQRGLRAVGVDPVLPGVEDQRTVMEAIYAVKSGTLGPTERRALIQVTEWMAAQGADIVLGACTEIPLALDPQESARPLIDPAVLLANRVIHEASSRTGSEMEAF